MSTEDKSSEIKEALRQGFLDGTSKMADRKCYGYDRTADGSLVINQEESATVQWIFESYCGGESLGKIANVWRIAASSHQQAKESGTVKQFSNFCPMRNTLGVFCSRKR